MLATVLLLAAGLIQSGFDHFYNLEYTEAIADFRAAVKEDPKDPTRHNHVAQAILYREMYRAGALESELVSGNNPFQRREKMNPSAADVAEFEAALRLAMEAARERMAAQPQDAGAHYALSVAYGVRANYNFLVRKSWLDALKDATEARKASRRTLELDPQFIDAQLIEGIHEYVVGSLSWTYKMLGFLVGFRGDKQNGLRLVRLVAEKGRNNRADAQVLLAAVYRRERQPGAALPLLNDLIRQFPRNYILRLELAQMHGDNGDFHNAWKTLEELEQFGQKNPLPNFRLLPQRILLARGNLLFWYRDYARSIEHMQQVVRQSNELDPNTILMAWLRMGMAYDTVRQRSSAQEAYRNAIAFAPESEIARVAKKYLSSRYVRPPNE
jgi:tetratricopeptide (TPR) repeat protein